MISATKGVGGKPLPRLVAAGQPETEPDDQTEDHQCDQGKRQKHQHRLGPRPEPVDRRVQPAGHIRRFRDLVLDRDDTLDAICQHSQRVRLPQ